MKILVFGGQGYMGRYFKGLYPSASCPSVDIADAHTVAAALDSEKPDVVINCAGKSGIPNVDWCEDHKMETLHSNVQGPLVLLQECGKRNIYWVHLSSGCIYEGDNEGRGFSEEDAPNFSGSFYSRSKAWSDQMLKEFPVLTLRLRMPFDGTLESRNLIVKLRKYKTVLHAQNSITYVPDLLATAQKLIEKRATGIFNVVNAGTISPYEAMTMYKEIVDPTHTFEKLSIAQLSGVTKAARSNCMLSTAKLEEMGIHLPNVHDAMRSALQKLKESTEGK